MTSKSNKTILKLGSRVKYFRHEALIGTGILVGKGEKNGMVIYDVTLDNGVKYWGYKDQFQPL